MSNTQLIETCAKAARVRPPVIASHGALLRHLRAQWQKGYDEAAGLESDKEPQADEACGLFCYVESVEMNDRDVLYDLITPYAIRIKAFFSYSENGITEARDIAKYVNVVGTYETFYFSPFADGGGTGYQRDPLRIAGIAESGGYNKALKFAEIAAQNGVNALNSCRAIMDFLRVAITDECHGHGAEI